MAKEPLYPHVVKRYSLVDESGVARVKAMKACSQEKEEGGRDIFVFTPANKFAGGALLIYSNNRDEAKLRARAVDKDGYYGLDYEGTLDEIIKKIKAKGEISWLYYE